MSTAIIVGHGPSLLKSPRGSEIDAFDYVIRQKRCQELLKHPEFYGTRKDAVCGSLTIARELPLVGAQEIWVFTDSRHVNIPDEDVEKLAESLPCEIRRDLCDEWNWRYRRKRTPFQMVEGMERKKTSDSLGHTHMSAGLHTLIYACDILKPDQVVLAGFDNVEHGGFTWSVTRGPEWDKYPDHRWDIEHAMVPEIADHFGVQITYL